MLNFANILHRNSTRGRIRPDLPGPDGAQPQTPATSANGVSNVNNVNSAENLPTTATAGGGASAAPRVPILYNRPLQPVIIPAAVQHQNFHAQAAAEPVSSSIADSQTVVPAQERDLQRARVTELQDKARALANDPIEDRNGRWKTGLKAAMFSLGQAFDPRNGVARDWNDFTARLGSGVGGFAGGLVNKKWDETLERERDIEKNNQQLEAETSVLEGLDARAAHDADLALKEEQTKAVPRKLILQQLKNEADAEYKRNLAELGKQKADEIAAYRDSIIELQTRGTDQKDKQIELLEKRIEETARHNKANEEIKISEGEKNRTAAQTRAETMAGSREKVAGMQINAARDRLTTQLQGANEIKRKEYVDRALERWKQRFVESNEGREPSNAEIEQQRRSIIAVVNQQ